MKPNAMKVYTYAAAPHVQCIRQITPFTCDASRRHVNTWEDVALLHVWDSGSGTASQRQLDPDAGYRAAVLQFAVKRTCTFARSLVAAGISALAGARWRTAC